jgi:eukaryotic-like serine/threonine-protein kinase
MAESSQSSAGPVGQAGSREELVRRFSRQRRGGQSPDLKQFLSEAGELSRADVTAILRVDQCERWRCGERVPVETYLRDYMPEAAESEDAIDLIYQEFLLREELGEAPTCDEYQQRFPKLAEQLRQQFEFHQALESGDGVGSKLTVAEATASDVPVGSSVGPMLDAGSPEDEQRRPQEVLQLHALFGADRAVLGDTTRTQLHSTPSRNPSQIPLNVPTIPGYEVRTELGRGGMGVVFEARQVCLDRVVALKLIPAGAHAGSEELARFRREAEAVARLKHSSIVQVYEVGERDGCPYLALELVEGGNLRQKLNGAPLPPEQAAQLVAQVARAVSYAHQQGIVHRDLKPANILLTADGTPKIVDFGLAKRLDADMGQTRSGAVIGTPSYMAPEQAEGKSKEVGPLADVYALGAILYELLTGRPPFRAVTLLDTLEQVRSQDPVPPRLLQPKLPRDLEAICLKCLEKEPGRRFLTAQALADDLDRFLAGEPTHTRGINLLEQITRQLNRNLRLLPEETSHSPHHRLYLLYLAPLPFVLQLLLYLAAGGKPFYAVASMGVILLTVLILCGVLLATHSVNPWRLSAAANRQIWSARVGLLLGLAMLALVSYLTAPLGAPWDPLCVYPLWIVLFGVTLIILGSVIWGRLYVIGLVLFAVAILMALRLEWSALLVGLVLSAVGMAVSLHGLRRISKEAAPEARNERR